jgi:hypothetical protein
MATQLSAARGVGHTFQRRLITERRGFATDLSCADESAKPNKQVLAADEFNHATLVCDSLANSGSLASVNQPRVGRAWFVDRLRFFM